MGNDDKPMSGLDWLEVYGACTCIVLVITSPVWFWDLMYWAIENWPVQG